VYTDDEPDEPDFKKLLTISNNGFIIIVWKPIEILACLLSSYYYAWILAFGAEEHIGVPRWSIIFEAIFAISMAINFMREYIPDGETVPVRDHAKIAKHYFKNGFWTDFIPLLPIPWALSFLHYSKVLYIIKIIRIDRGFRIFDVTKVLNAIKNFLKNRIERKIKENPNIGEDNVIDHNNIDQLMITNYCLKTFKLIVTILNIAYFLAMFWLLFCQVTEDIMEGEGHDVGEEGESTNKDYFLDYYGMSYLFGIDGDDEGIDDKYYKEWRAAIVAVYFSFTSLSTVGFGDYHPRSNSERLLVAFVLLFGVAIFSYIMGIFIEILGDF